MTSELIKPQTQQTDIRSHIVDFKVRDKVSDSGTPLHVVSGYAVVFNKTSEPMPFIETVLGSAFNDVDLTDVKLLYNHNWDNILSRTDSETLTLSIDKQGLFFEATLPDTTLGRDVYTNIQNGNLKGMSFGFTIADDDWDTQGDVMTHTVNQIGIVAEISITPDPAYTQTSIAVQRSLAGNEVKGVNTENNKEENEVAKDETTVTVDPTVLAQAIAQATVTALEAATDDSDTSDADTPADTPAENTDDQPDDSETDAAVPPKDDTKPADKPVDTPVPDAPADTPAPKAPATKPETRDDDEPDDDSDDVETDSKDTQTEKRGLNTKMENLTADKKKNNLVRSFAEALKTQRVERAATTGIGLSDGSIIIPQDILTVEHETHQFPRLGSLVRTVSVKHTTGKLPVMWDSTETLSEHTEYSATAQSSMLKIVPINWDLKTYTGAYIYSQDLLSDSDYNWQSELSSSLTTLRDNTDDVQIITALTSGVTAVQSSDLVADIKTALNMTLKPNDSSAASIVLSQAAFNALDQMKDGEGRPLVQPDLTKGTGSTILGKTVVVIDDALFPGAKAGDINIVIAPLQKAVINFKNNEITGKFQDTYDVWYQQLGIYLREDVVQARKDLIVNIKGTAAAAAPASTK